MPSKSRRQAVAMAVAAHDPAAAKRMKIKQSTAREWNKKDAKSGILKKRKKR